MIYVVRRTFDNVSSELYRNSNKELAIEFCDKKAYYNVYNLSNGALVHKSTYGDLKNKDNTECEKEVKITNPLGTYIKAMPNFFAKNIIEQPIKEQKVVVLNTKDFNGYYYAKVYYKREWYYGYILFADLNII